MDSALLTSSTISSSLSHFNPCCSHTSTTTCTITSLKSSNISISSTTLPFLNPKPLKSSTSLLLVCSPTTTMVTATASASARVRAAASSSNSDPIHNNHHHHHQILLQNLKTTATAGIFFAAAASVMIFGKFHHLPARAATAAQTVTEEVENQQDESSPALSQFLESNSGAVDSLKSLLQRKLEIGGEEGEEEALRILKKLVAAQPHHTEWKFLMARLLNEMGKPQDARDAFEEILRSNPLSFEALFENALLMDRCGERGAVIGRLEEALRTAEVENKVKEARDVRLIMAQIHFLQKNVDEALKSYEELEREDPSDFRPYFCKGMIYSLLDRNSEAKQQFEKYRQLSPKKFEVEGYLRSPLSRMKLFGTSDEN